MNTGNLASLGFVIVAGAAIGWLVVGAETPADTASPAAQGENGAGVQSGSGPASAWGSQVPPQQRSASSDGGPDEGLPPPPPGIDVAEDATRRAQANFSPPSAAPASVAAPRAAPSPAPIPTRPAPPAGGGWTPSPDSGWAPPADARQAGWGNPR